MTKTWRCQCPEDHNNKNNNKNNNNDNNLPIKAGDPNACRGSVGRRLFNLRSCSPGSNNSNKNNNNKNNRNNSNNNNLTLRPLA